MWKRFALTAAVSVSCFVVQDASARSFTFEGEMMFFDGLLGYDELGDPIQPADRTIRGRVSYDPTLLPTSVYGDTWSGASYLDPNGWIEFEFDGHVLRSKGPMALQYVSGSTGEDESSLQFDVNGYTSETLPDGVSLDVTVFLRGEPNINENTRPSALKNANLRTDDALVIGNLGQGTGSIRGDGFTPSGGLIGTDFYLTSVNVIPTPAAAGLGLMLASLAAIRRRTR